MIYLNGGTKRFDVTWCPEQDILILMIKGSIFKRITPLWPDMVVYSGVMNHVVLSTGLPYQIFKANYDDKYTDHVFEP
tara:strand:+ start:195 stop:428 length:234 start_codon:yes stop_codon:yes gene_type:complete